jgi:ribose transport system ATP-binding protein
MTTLEVRGLDKSFGPTHAVRQVSATFDSDQVTAIMGGNGAGKSTLRRLIAGEHSPDAGAILLDGQPIDLARHNPLAAHQLGIRVVHQELSLCASLTVAENFFLEQPGPRWGLRWRSSAARAAREALTACFGAPTGIDATATVSQLSIAQQQMVEIARAASAPGTKVLILDEPTSALGADRLGAMRQLVTSLRQAGVLVLVITHKIAELPHLASRVLVMREGAIGADLDIAEADEPALIAHMAGHDIAPRAAGANTATRLLGDTRARWQDRDGAAIAVRAGQVVGLAGLQGSGQAEVLQDVFARAKHCQVSGSLAYISGDRRREGILGLWDAVRNLAVSQAVQQAGWRIFGTGWLARLATPWLRQFGLPEQADRKQITLLSGGMQQTVRGARGRALDAAIELLTDPTRGVDAATKTELYAVIDQAAAQGKAVLWYSSEDTEMARCDTVYVLSAGAVVGRHQRDDIDQLQLLSEQFTTGAGTTAGTPGHRDRAGLSWLVSRPWLLALVGLVIAVGIIQSIQAPFSSYIGVELVTSLLPVITFAALAQTIVIGLGDIDLGVGAFMGFVLVVCSTLLATSPAVGVLVLLAGVAAYPALGALIELRRIPPIVATLGASFIWLGLGLTILPTVGGAVPTWLIRAFSWPIPLIPEPVWLTVAGGVVAYLLVYRTRTGVLIRAFGSNREALAHAGWSPLVVRMKGYALAGGCATMAGLAFAAVATAGDVFATQGYTLSSIAAAIVGGSQFSGGWIAPGGVVLGAGVIGLMAILLSALGVQPMWTAAAQGTVLLVVMGLRRLTGLASGSRTRPGGPRSRRREHR